MADHRRDDITSQISIDDSNLVIVDECDDSISDIEIDISEPSPSSHDVEEKPAQSDYRKTASEQCLPHAGTSASQNNPWTTDSVLKNQPFIKLRRLDPAEVKRLTAVKSRVTDEGNSAKSSSKSAKRAESDVLSVSLDVVSRFLTSKQSGSVKKTNAGSKREPLPLKTSPATTTKSKANTERSVNVIQPPASKVRTAVADSTSVKSARSSADAAKRKSAEKNEKQNKKMKLDKSFNKSRARKDTSAAQPLMGLVISKKPGGVKDSRASETTPADESSSVLRVSGLPLTADKQTVVALFPGCSISAVHLTCLPNGQPGGGAYVEFSMGLYQKMALQLFSANPTSGNIKVVSASHREMEWVLQRCRTYRQTESAASVTANWAVQLDSLPKDCTILDITRFLSDCKVENVLFPMATRGLWWYTAYVILKSADDVDKACAKHGHCIGKDSVRVSASSQKSLSTVNEMLKDIENDKAASRYVVWLRFAPLLTQKDCRKQNVLEFLKGCKVGDVCFNNVSPIKRLGAFVELKSKEDVKLALSRSNRYIKRSSVLVIQTSSAEMRRAKDAQLKANLASDEDSDSHVGTHTTGKRHDNDNRRPSGPGGSESPPSSAAHVDNSDTVSALETENPDEDYNDTSQDMDYRNMPLTSQSGRRIPVAASSGQCGPGGRSGSGSRETPLSPRAGFDATDTISVSETDSAATEGVWKKKFGMWKKKFTRWGPENQDVDYRDTHQDMDYRGIDHTPLESESGRPIPVTMCHGERKTNQRQQNEKTPIKRNLTAVSEIGSTLDDADWNSLCLIVVENLGQTCTKRDLETAFSLFGLITMMKYTVNTNALIKYTVPDGARLAIQRMNLVQLCGCCISVRYSVSSVNRTPLINALLNESMKTNRIYVASVHPDVQHWDLKSAFETAGVVMKCQLAVNKLNPNNNLGYGYIEYETKEMANAAVARMNNVNFRGSSLQVSWALIPARLQRDNFTEGVTTPSLAAAVQAAASVSMRLSESESTMKAAENEKTRRLGAALQAAAAIAEELAGRHAKQKLLTKPVGELSQPVEQKHSPAESTIRQQTKDASPHVTQSCNVIDVHFSSSRDSMLTLTRDAYVELASEADQQLALILHQKLYKGSRIKVLKSTQHEMMLVTRHRPNKASYIVCIQNLPTNCSQNNVIDLLSRIERPESDDVHLRNISSEGPESSSTLTSESPRQPGGDLQNFRADDVDRDVDYRGSALLTTQSSSTRLSSVVYDVIGKLQHVLHGRRVQTAPRYTAADSDSASDGHLHPSESHHSVPSKDVCSFEVEEQKQKSHPSQHVTHISESSELGRERRLDFDNIPMTNQLIFSLMKDRVNDRKSSEERAVRHSSQWNVRSPSEYRDLDSGNTPSSLSRSLDVVEHSTPDLETGNKSDRELTGYSRDNIQYHHSTHSYQSGAGDIDRQYSSFSPDVDAGIQSNFGHKWTVYDDLSLSGTPQVHPVHQSQAADVGDYSSPFSSSHEVQWLDSWNSASGDVDLRNYRRDY